MSRDGFLARVAEQERLLNDARGPYPAPPPVLPLPAPETSERVIISGQRRISRLLAYSLAAITGVELAACDRAGDAVRIHLFLSHRLVLCDACAEEMVGHGFPVPQAVPDGHCDFCGTPAPLTPARFQANTLIIYAFTCPHCLRDLVPEAGIEAVGEG